MPRPNLYNDSEILWKVAEYWARPAENGLTSLSEAIRRALTHVHRSDHWPVHVHKQAFDRIKKKFADDGERLVAAILATPNSGPVQRSTLLGQIFAPDELQLRNEVDRLQSRLRFASEWASDLADEIARQLRCPSSKGVNPDLLEHAKRLTEVVDTEFKTQFGKNPYS